MFFKNLNISLRWMCFQAYRKKEVSHGVINVEFCYFPIIFTHKGYQIDNLKLKYRLFLFFNKEVGKLEILFSVDDKTISAGKEYHTFIIHENKTADRSLEILSKILIANIGKKLREDVLGYRLLIPKNTDLCPTQMSGSKLTPMHGRIPKIVENKLYILTKIEKNNVTFVSHMLEN